MAHRYSLPVQVELGTDGTSTGFTRRGERYTVLQMLATWHLRDRWWVSPVAALLGDEARGHSDRHYYCLLVIEQQVFEVYHDTISNARVPEVV